MDSFTQKLFKILRLEAEDGHKDRAVIGGLARYADTWLQEAGAGLGQESQGWVEDVAGRLRSYSSLGSEQERLTALGDLIQLLEKGPSVPDAQGAPVPEQEVVETPSVPEVGTTQASTQPGLGEGADLTSTPTAVEEPPPVVAPPPADQTPEPISAPVQEDPPGLDAPITVVRGVGERQASRLARLGVRSVRDLVMFIPRRYDDFSNLKPINRLEYGEDVTIIAQVVKANSHKTRRGRSLFKALLSDDTGTMEATWFNQPYLAERIKPGKQIVVSGTVDEYLGRLCFTSPEWEALQKELLHTGRLVAVYPLTKGLGARWLRGLAKRTVDYWAPRIPDHLSGTIRGQEGLVTLETALRQIHSPDNNETLAQARHRLAFDDMFIFQLGLLRQRQAWRSVQGRQLSIDDSTLQRFVLSLSFQLTSAQQRALGQILDDIRSKYPMNRLLQGDVGSGKTVVAAAVMALTAAAGSQAAIMAPTEILAEQHYSTLTKLFSGMPERQPRVRLLTGSITGAEREEIYAGLADGSIEIAVGTHALIQEGVNFRDLALVVIDEQHRFGVRQRAALREKGRKGDDARPTNPHLLVMTATPIPRSLQLTIWGHLDVSLIDEMPPGRQPIQTRVILPRERERAYTFLRTQIEAGHQAFIICPLVEESERIEAKAAVEEHERLQSVFTDQHLGLLHGRMKSDEKESTMSAFARGDLDILVATSVVEVGIDVPNATVMLIEGAERFGLSQLHQFRGRVGRGEYPSYCLLVSESATPVAKERLEAVESTTDGFELAQKDLELRGPGEFLGVRQSGLPDLKMASLTDLRLLEAAREAAKRLFTVDPDMKMEENRLLARRVAAMWSDKGEVS
jgi:ATP-dependent DNA helicase RecG